MSSIIENITKHLNFLGFKLLKENETISLENDNLEFEIIHSESSLDYYLLTDKKFCCAEHNLENDTFTLRNFKIRNYKTLSSDFTHLYIIEIDNGISLTVNDNMIYTDKIISYLKEEFKHVYRKQKIAKLNNQ